MSDEDTRERVIRDLMKFPPVPSDDTLDESIETVFADAVAMGHKALANHYACAIANWNAAMDALDEARRERDDLVARLRDTLDEIARLRALAASVVKGVDDWNAAVEKIIGRKVEGRWGDLDALRAALAPKGPANEG